MPELRKNSRRDHFAREKQGVSAYERSIAESLGAQGTLAIAQEKHVQAGRLYGKALSIFHRLDDKIYIVNYIVQLACVLMNRGRSKESARLVGLVQKQGELNSGIRKKLTQLWSEREAAVAPDEISHAVAEGEELEMETAVLALIAEFGGEDDIESSQQ